MFLQIGNLVVWRRWGWPVVILFCALPVLRWLMMAPVVERFSGLVAICLSLGQIFGLVGLGLFTMNLLLATRLRLFEDLFGGLNKVFIAHHIIGGLALVVILVHPVLLSLRLVPSGWRQAALLFVPRLDDWPVAFGILALVGLVSLLVLTFYVKLPYRVWLVTHKFMGVVYLLVALHVVFTPNDVSNDAVLRFYVWALLILGIAAYVYRTLLPNVFVRRYPYTVRSAVMLAPGVVQIDLWPQKNMMNFLAGQFVFISVRRPGISAQWHPFTVSSPPGTAQFSITLKSLGEYTGHLVNMLPQLPGTKVMVEGAYGRFSFRNFGTTSQIWIAGGIGITPFLAMARALGPAPYQIDLYYSVKTESELVNVAELAAVQSGQANEWFRVIPFVSEKQGFLTAQYIQKASGSLMNKEILLCGPPSMMHALHKQLVDLGVPKSRIHSEEFSLYEA